MISRNFLNEVVWEVLPDYGADRDGIRLVRLQNIKGLGFSVYMVAPRRAPHPPPPPYHPMHTTSLTASSVCSPPLSPPVVLWGAGTCGSLAFCSVTIKDVLACWLTACRWSPPPMHTTSLTASSFCFPVSPPLWSCWVLALVVL